MKKTNPLVPRFASKPIAALVLGGGMCAVAIASAILSQPASAQSAPGAKPLGDLGTQQNERSSTSGSFGDGNFSVFDLIHRAQTGTGELTEPSQSITNAATKFRLEQQRRLANPQPSGNEQLVKPEENPVNNSTVGQ